MGDQNEAVIDCGNAIKINPKYAEAYYVRGLIKLATGDRNGGCYDLSKSGELGNSSSYGIIKDYCN
jgi:hypothetical protein